MRYPGSTNSNLVARKKNHSRSLWFPVMEPRSQGFAHIPVLFFFGIFNDTARQICWKFHRVSQLVLRPSHIRREATTRFETVGRKRVRETTRSTNRKFNRFHARIFVDFPPPPANRTISLANQRKRQRDWTFHRRLHAGHSLNASPNQIYDVEISKRPASGRGADRQVSLMRIIFTPRFD